MKHSNKTLFAFLLGGALALTLTNCSSSDPSEIGISGSSSSEPSSSSSDDGGSSSSSDGGVSSSSEPSSSSSDDGDSSSSSDGGSSSSEEPSSSSGGDGVCHSEAVKIGDQCWMKRNLNVPHNEGNGNSWCYGDKDGSYNSNCDKYGRLYDWAAAMDLPSVCNDYFCSDRINTQHTGLCPAGFHVPTNADWDKLMRFVDGKSSSSGKSPYSSETAGKYLKAVSGWDSYATASGTDKYGFSALPGGYYDHINDNFYKAGRDGYWWSTNENEDSNNIADYRSMYYWTDDADWDDMGAKGYGRSLRCLQN